MSLVEITQHDEVIYTILDKPPPEPPKSPRYQSQLEKDLKSTKAPQLRRTFGWADIPLKGPGHYLKKGEGIGPPMKKSDHKCYVSGKLPAVPRRPPPEKASEKPKVNFRVVNIKKVVKARPKTPERRLVDTRDGHIKRIKGSGEEPEFCLRPDFGQMPAYLVRRNRRIQSELARIKYEEDHRKSLCQLVSAEEREKLLKDLKHNWHLLQTAFLQLPMLTDTGPKIMKKQKMEAQLKQLESDIAIIERNPYIYVYDQESKDS